MTRRTPFPAILWTAVLTAGLSAQAPPASSEAPLDLGTRTPIHTAAADPTGGEYGIWGAGATYKASFHGDPTFVPFLGADAPESHSLSWRTLSVRAGDVELLASGGAPERRSHTYRYEYRYPGLVEAYDVLPEGLEQTFVLARRPATPGDLVITGRVQTRLHGDAIDNEHSDILFADAAGKGLVAYGAATAIDVAGRTCAMTTSHRDGRIELRLRGDWLEAAQFPVTVDPLLAPVTIASWPSPVRSYGRPESIDVGRDDETNELMVVFARWVSATDVDCWAYLCDDGFTNPVLVFADTALWNTVGPRCAFVGGADKWIVAFGREFSSGSRGVRYHRHDKGDRSLQTNVTHVIPPAGQHDWRPDVGGTRSTVTGTTALMVFQREDTGTTTWSNVSRSRVYGVVIDLATGVQSTQFRVGPFFGLTNVDDERPTVNQIAYSDADPWVVVYQTFDNRLGMLEWDLVGYLVDSAGTVSGHRWTGHHSYITTIHKLWPVVAGERGRFLVGYGTANVNAVAPKYNGVANTVWAERFDFTGTAATTFPAWSLQTLNPGMERFVIGGVAVESSTRSHWGVVWHDEVVGHVHAARVGFNGRVTEEGLALLATVEKGLAGGVTFDDDSNEFPLVFGVRSQTGNGAQPISGCRLTFPSVRAPSTYGTSCGSATIRWVGRQWLGSEFSRVVLSSAPPNTLALFLLALAPTNRDLGVFGMTGCRLLVENTPPAFIGSAILFTDGNGIARVDMPLPEWLASGTMYWQAGYASPGVNPAGFLTTVGLRVSFR